MPQEGTVKWYNTQKGYGFIDASGKDVFVHASEIKTPGVFLKEGQKVSFELSNGPKGEQATNVLLLSEAEPVIRESGKNIDEQISNFRKNSRAVLKDLENRLKKR